MKIIVLGMKLWLAVALVAFLAVCLVLWQTPDLNIVIDDQVVHLGDGGLTAFGTGIFLALIATVAVAVLLALVGLLVPLMLLVIACILVLALGGAGLAVLMALLFAAAPLLLPLLLCVLLVRAFTRPKRRIA